jgi:SulP family sulfate permease
MAYALLAGLDPIVGLYASTLPLILYALLGSSRQLAVGPVAMVSLLAASGLAPVVANDPAAGPGAAMTLALLVGLIQVGMGLVRLGFLVRFLSHPVVAGFTSAAAIHIGLSQLRHVLGAPIASSHHALEVLASAVEHLDQIHPPTLALAAGTGAVLLLLQRSAPKFPRFLLVVSLGTALAAGLDLGSAGVALVGSVPAGLPWPGSPPLDPALIQQLLPTALTIALIGFLESISVAKGFARKQGEEVQPDQELIALGAANLGAALVRGYPVTGGFSRTAVNAQAGAQSGLASLVTGLVVVATLLFLTPLFTFLPKAVLAAIILVAVLGLIDVHEARHLWKVSRSDFGLMGLTFLATLLVGIEEGILLGVGASLLWFVWRMSSPHVAVLGRVPGTDIYRNVERFPEAETCPGLLAVRIDAPLFFANTLFLKTTLRDLEARAPSPIKRVILDAKAIPSLDASADATLHELAEDYQRRGVELWLSGVRGPARDVLRASGFIDRLGADRFVERVVDAAQACPGRPALRLVQANEHR